MALTDKLTAIADAIRAKDGTTGTMTLDQMPGKIAAITTADNIVHGDIPNYIKAAALEVAKKVRAVQTDESITFIAMSDAHQLDTRADIVAGNKHAGMAAKVLAYALPNLDFCCYLGDYTAGRSTTTLAEGRQHIKEINADIDEAFSGIPQFRTLGNHDSLQYSKAQNGSVLTAAELYSMVGAYNSGATMGSTTEGYCYRDFESKKLRVICLNTAEATEKEYVSDAQKLWFANTLKAVGAKSGWNVLILSHHPLDWGGVRILSNIVKAYVDGSSITVSSGNTINFSGSNSAKILAAIHGHVHCFKAAQLNSISSSTGTPYNVWRVATPNMCFARNNEYGQNGKAEYYGIEFGEDTTYNKTANSANDTAFVVNVCNPSQQKVYSFCYGAGYDREVFTGIQTVAVTGVSLNASSGELIVNGQTTLTATVVPANATNKTVTWTSSAPTVATVVNGVVTALSAGTAVITAKTADGGFTATYSLTVKVATVPSDLYSITRNLTNCASSNTADTAAEGAAYTTTLSPTGTFKKLGAITVTMGGVDISASAVSGSTITIANVTGNIVITCEAVITNIIDTVGISADTRLSTSNGENKAKVGWATIGANMDATSLIHLVAGDVLRIKGMTLPNAQTGGSAAVRYSETAEFTSAGYIYNGHHWSQMDFTSSGDIVTVTASVDSYIRISLACADPSTVIATINEPIT